MNVKQLKEFLAALPDDMLIGIDDVNFGRVYCDVDEDDLKVYPPGNYLLFPGTTQMSFDE